MERRKIYDALLIHLHKTQKNEIGINLLKTIWNQNLTARSTSASSFHHNAVQTARPPLLLPDSTPPPIGAKPAGASHHDESRKKKLKKTFSISKNSNMIFC